MRNDVKFSCIFRNDLWAKAAKTVMLLENNILMNSIDLSPAIFGNGKRGVMSSLQKFGVMCIMAYCDH